MNTKKNTHASDILPLMLAAVLGPACAGTPAGADESDTSGAESSVSDTGETGDSDTGEPEGIIVDASDPEGWVYLRVDGTQVEAPDTPEDSLDWDLGFRRTQIKTNSGTSGAHLAGGRLGPDGSVYDEITTSPTTRFRADVLLPIPGPPGSGEFSGNTALNDWFAYDEATHEVSPKDQVFLVRSAVGDYAKLQIRAYEDGVFTLGLDPVDREVNVEAIEVDASDDAAWVHLDLRLAEPTAPEDPAADGGWDVAFSRTQVQSNSGTSGVGIGGALDPMQTELSAIESAPAGAYAIDEMLPLPGPPGSGEFSGNPVLNGWYDYDTVNHVVSPKDMAFVLRTADGGYAKLKITGYEDGVYALTWAYAGAGQIDF